MFVVSPIAFLGFIDIWPGEPQTAEMEHRAKAESSSLTPEAAGRGNERRAQGRAGKIILRGECWIE
jgi:predicted anti-sigma-YlaC factor YlaD